MTPTTVLKNGKVVIGSPRGVTILNTVLQVITNVIDHHMSPADAVAAKRINQQWLPGRISHEPDLATLEVMAELDVKGHALEARKLHQNEASRRTGRQDAAEIETGLRIGVPDNRRPAPPWRRSERERGRTVFAW